MKLSYIVILLILIYLGTYHLYQPFTNGLPYSPTGGDYNVPADGIPYHINYLPCEKNCKEQSIYPYYTWDGE